MACRRSFSGLPPVLPARIAGVPIGKLIEARGESLDGMRRKIENSVRYANITIIEGNDASQCGIGIVAARITEMVLRDERAVVPIGRAPPTRGIRRAGPQSLIATISLGSSAA